jgi:hypothetical protein
MILLYIFKLIQNDETLTYNGFKFSKRFISRNTRAIAQKSLII